MLSASSSSLLYVFVFTLSISSAAPECIRSGNGGDDGSGE